MKTFKILLSGLIAAQAIAAVQVYLSNARLAEALALVRQGGYLTIPGPYIAAGLRDLGPALGGGLFFTLSVGAGISSLAIFTIWVWDRLFSRSKWMLIPVLGAWALCLAAVNSRGFCAGPTAYFIFVPLIVYAASRKWMPPKEGKKEVLREAACAMPILILGFIWASQMDDDIFISIRDRLLLSNPVGAKINDFYYSYTMYPAEVFKTLDQKTVKTCDLEYIRQRPFAHSLEKILISHDYFAVDGYGHADLTLKEEAGVLLFHRGRNIILRADIKEFFLQPSRILKDFSDKSDRCAFFREIVFLSIFTGFPAFLYALLYAIFHTMLQALLSPKYAWMVATMICFIIGTAFLLPFIDGDKSINESNLVDAVQSDHWQDRVAALKFIRRKNLEVAGFGDYVKMLRSPYAAERYWLAIALGVSRKPESYRDVWILLDDPSPNVVCKALEALGKRGHEEAVREIVQRIKTSQYHWYEQWYAYNALKRLGWNQTGLK